MFLYHEIFYVGIDYRNIFVQEVRFKIQQDCPDSVQSLSVRFGLRQKFFHIEACLAVVIKDAFIDVTESEICFDRPEKFCDEPRFFKLSRADSPIAHFLANVAVVRSMRNFNALCLVNRVNVSCLMSARSYKKFFVDC